MTEPANNHAARTDSVTDPASDLTTRLAVTAVALAIAFAATYTPAPGVNLDALAGPAGAMALDSGFFSRLSITSLWFTPVLSALLLTEALKLAVPPQSALPQKKGMRQAGFNRFLLVAALLLAAFQAYGLATALEGIQATGGIPAVEEPGVWFRITYMMTQVAGVALLIALADQITRFGIGSGFWVMIAAGELAGLPSVVGAIAAGHQAGHLDARSMFGLAAAALIAIAGTIALFRAYVRPSGDAMSGMLGAEDLLIPAFLGAGIAQFLFGVTSVFAYIGGEQVSPGSTYRLDDPLLLVLTALLIVLVAYLRALQRRDLYARGQDTDVRPALVAGAATAAITIVFNILSARVEAQILSGPLLIATTLIAVSAAPQWLDQAVRGPGEQNRD